MVATTALSQKFFDLYPRIPERLELFPGLTATALTQILDVLINNAEKKRS